MNIFKIILLALLLTTIQAKSSKWQRLQAIDVYSGSDYNLKESVSYMEIRWYGDKKGKKITKVLKLYREPLESYPKKIISKFRSLKPKYSNSADIGWSGNAFFIDKKGKMFQMDMKKDIISLLGKIDRAAEVELVLYLNHLEGRHYYKKVSKGYKIKSIEKLKGCTSSINQGLVEKSGRYTLAAEYTLQREGCAKRVHTKFINNKRVNYESYNKIVLDDKANIYLLGKAKRSHNEYETIYLLERYNSSGDRVWSRRVKADYLNRLYIVGKSIYLLKNRKPIALFSLNGKKKHLKNIDIAKRDDSTIDAKYSPEGLPNKREALGFYLRDYAKDKKGNIYIVGSEVFYPSGGPDDVPDGECGNVEEVMGALVAKLNSRGKTIWARVIDRDK